MPKYKQKTRHFYSLKRIKLGLYKNIETKRFSWLEKQDKKTFKYFSNVVNDVIIKACEKLQCTAKELVSNYELKTDYQEGELIFNFNKK